MAQITEKEEAEFVTSLRDKQNNILPPDIIRNDREIDDVLWNGPTSASRIQRVGMFVIGIVLFGMSSVMACASFERSDWLGLIIMSSIAGAGLRIIYKSLVKRTLRQSR